MLKHFRRWLGESRRNQFLAACGALVAGGAIAAVGVAVAVSDDGERREEVIVRTATPSPAAHEPTRTPRRTATSSPTPEPVAQRIAYVGADGDVYIIDAAGSGERKLFDVPTEAGDGVRNLRWAPDGSKFAVTKSPKDVVYIVTADGEKLLEARGVTFLGWLSAGESFAVARPPALEVEAALLVLDLQGNTVIGPLTGVEPASPLSSLSADNRRLAYWELVGEGGICGKLRGVVVDLQAGQVAPVDPAETPVECGVGVPTFSPTDPSLLAYGDRIFDLSAGEQRSLPGRAITWSPDGKHLLVIGQHAQVLDIDEGTAVIEFDIDLLGIDVPAVSEQSAWSYDSRFLVTSDSVLDPDRPSILHVRDITSGSDSTATIPKDSSQLGAFFLQFSPNGQHILFSSSLTTSREDPNHRWFLLDLASSNLRPIAEGREAAWQP